MLSIDVSPQGVNVTCRRCGGRGQVVAHDEDGEFYFATCPGCDGKGMLTPEEIASFRPHEIPDVVASMRQTAEQLTVTADKLEALYQKGGA